LIASDKHHIGGSGSPLIWLCREHHGMVHGGLWNPEHPALTRAGLARAKAAGRIGGNPGLRAGDPEAIRKVRAARDAAHWNSVLASLDVWLPTVREMRPARPWGDVVRVLNRITNQQLHWTAERLRRTVRRLVSEGLADATLLEHAPRKQGDDRLVRLVARIAIASPNHSLQQIANQLETMHERTARGGTRWHPSSVRHLLICGRSRHW
jgi:hypothetical protein